MKLRQILNESIEITSADEIDDVDVEYQFKNDRFKRIFAIQKDPLNGSFTVMKKAKSGNLEPILSGAGIGSKIKYFKKFQTAKRVLNKYIEQYH